MIDYLVIIQARLNSTRLPGKALMTVGGVPMVKRVWTTAKAAMAGTRHKVVVAWPERYPDLDENNVLERFQRLVREFPCKNVIRLTADCPLIRPFHIWEALRSWNGVDYYYNRLDGYDVQIFSMHYLFNGRTHKEHVIEPPCLIAKGDSVNTTEDLERVRKLAR